MKIKNLATKWIFDAVLFVGLLLAFFLDFTGVFLHQCLGVALGIFIGYHLLSHWNWVKSVTRNFRGRSSRQGRFFYIIDTSLLFGFSLILVTGLVISTWFGLSLENYTAWRDFHETISIITLLLVVVKICGHWRWITTTANRYIFAHPASELNPHSRQSVASPFAVNRQEFLKVAGLVSAAAFLAIQGALANNIEDGVNETSLIQDAAGTSNSISQSSSQPTSESSSKVGTSPNYCQASCRKGCSYPGECHRFVDSNQNNKCDNGECL